MQRILRWTWLLVAAIVLYTGAIMAMRWQSSRDREKDVEQQQAEAGRRIVEQYGSGELKLLMFYANPPRIAAGGRSLLCYGVANARTVKIDPAVADVSPSLSRCVEVRPSATTRYRLEAAHGSGAQVSETVTVEVR